MERKKPHMICRPVYYVTYDGLPVYDILQRRFYLNGDSYLVTLGQCTSKRFFSGIMWRTD